MFKGKTPQEIEGLIACQNITPQLKLYLREKYVRNQAPPKPNKPPRRRKTTNWAKRFEGRSDEEIESLISAAKISYCMKSKLRRQYLRKGEKLTNEQRSQIYHECGEIGRNWNV